MISEISDIKYKNEVIDKGLIIGNRKYRWLLKRQYEPCWAKRYRKYVSVLSPHKKYFDVYIPFSELKKGAVYTVVNINRYEYTITELNEQFVTYSVKEVEIPKIKFEINYEQEELPI